MEPSYSLSRSQEFLPRLATAPPLVNYMEKLFFYQKLLFQSKSRWFGGHFRLYWLYPKTTTQICKKLFESVSNAYNGGYGNADDIIWWQFWWQLFLCWSQMWDLGYIFGKLVLDFMYVMTTAKPVTDTPNLSPT